jgi:uncharacterized damage-inducible protein DinB
MDLTLIKSMNSYNNYANHLVLETAARLTEEELTRQSSPSHGTVLALLLHMLGVELFFYKVCCGEPMPQRSSSAPPSLAEIQGIWKQLEEERDATFQNLQEDFLDGEIHFQVAGNDYHLPRWQLLTQAFMSSTHHRGELSIVLSHLGFPLPTLDIIIPFINESGQQWVPLF